MNNNISERGLEFVQLLSGELARGNVDLPSFPDLAFRIKRALDDPNASAKRVATVVGTDPVFTARLLNVANSAAMGTLPDVQIREIPTAIARMGFKMAQTVAMSIALQQLMKKESGSKLAAQFDQLWWHSLSVAAISYLVAKNYTKINPDEAMIAGLMHDVGKIYIMVRAEEHAQDLCNDFARLEQVMYDWHTRVGQAILKNWSLPDDIVKVVFEHESLDRVVETADLSDVVLVSNLCAQAMDIDGTKLSTQSGAWIKIPAFQRLGLDKKEIFNVTEHSREEIESIVMVLGDR